MLPHDAMTDCNSRFPSPLEFTSIHPTRFVLGEERGSNLGIIRYCPFVGLRFDRRCEVKCLRLSPIN